MEFFKKLAELSIVFLRSSSKHQKIVNVPLYIVKVSSQPVHQAPHALRTVGQTKAATSALKTTPRCAQGSFSLSAGARGIWWIQTWDLELKRFSHLSFCFEILRFVELICVFHNGHVESPVISHNSDIFPAIFWHNVHRWSIRAWCAFKHTVC